MDVEDPHRERCEQLRLYDPHEAGEDNRVATGVLQQLDATVLGGAFELRLPRRAVEVLGWDVVSAGAVEYLRVRNVGKDEPDFIVRNMNKAILGSGDALLIAAGEYRWRCSERAEAFRSFSEREKLPGACAGLYERAVRYKMEPEPVLPEDPAGMWRTCRSFYLDAVRRVAGVSGTASAKDVSSGLSRRAKRYRSFKNLLRWARRTGKVRFPGMCDAPVVTVLGLLYAELSSSGEPMPCPPGLRRLWDVFN